MVEYTTTTGISYHSDEKAKGIEVSYAVNGCYFKATLVAEVQTEIGMLLANVVPPSANQMRLLDVTE